MHLDEGLYILKSLRSDRRTVLMMGNYLVASSELIRVAIDPRRLESLIREGQIEVTDFTCLDHPSKRGVWSMLRSLTANKLLKS